MLPLTFVDPEDYDKVQEADRVSLVGLSDLAPGKVVLYYMVTIAPCTKSSPCIVTVKSVNK